MKVAAKEKNDRTTPYILLFSALSMIMIVLSALLFVFVCNLSVIDAVLHALLFGAFCGYFVYKKLFLKNDKAKLSKANNDYFLSKTVESFSDMPYQRKLLIIIIAIPAAVVIFTALIYGISNVFSEFSLYSVLALSLFMLAVFHRDGDTVSGRDLLKLFTVALIVRTAFCFLYNLEPVSDFWKTYFRAQLLSEAPVSQWSDILHTAYTKTFPSITPYILYETFVIKLFGKGYVALQIINVICSSATCVFVAKIAESIFCRTNERKKRPTALCAGYLMVFNPVALFFISVLSCQHIAICLCLCALYFFICAPLKNNWFNIILGSVVLAFSHLMRSEMTVMIIAVGCFAVYRLFEILFKKKQHDAYAVLKIIAQAACIVITFRAVIFAVDALLLGLDIISVSISDTNLSYKVLVGINTASEGRFNSGDMELLLNGEFDKINEYVIERLKHPLELINLFSVKIKNNFADNSSVFYFDPNAQAGSVKSFIKDHVCTQMNNAYMLSLLFGLFFSVFAWIRKHKQSSVLFFIFMTGLICAFLIVEIQPRYLQILLPVYSVFAADGCMAAAEKIKGYFNGQS